jgi:hypothetical protein
MQSGQSLDQIAHQDKELSNGPSNFVSPPVLDYEAKVGCDRLKHDDFGVIGDKLVGGLNGVVLDHSMQIGRSEAPNIFIAVYLVENTLKLSALVPFEVPYHHTVLRDAFSSQVNHPVTMEFV